MGMPLDEARSVEEAAIRQGLRGLNKSEIVVVCSHYEAEVIGTGVVAMLIGLAKVITRTF